MATKTTPKKTASKKTTKSASTAKNGTSRKRSTASSSSKLDKVIIRRAKSTSWMAVIESLVIGALGICLLVNPDGMFQIIFYVVGIFLMIRGVYKIINYFAVRGKYDFYNNDLLYGVIALVFGILAVVLWEQLGRLIGIAVGAWMIYGALVRMNTAIKLHTAKVRDWFYVLLLSMIMLALGIYMVISATGAPTIIGWIMLACAGISIVNDVLFIRHLDAVAE